MAKVDATVDINRPIEEVFDYASDPAKLPEWQQAVLEVTPEGRGPIGVGSKFRGISKFLGRRLDIAWEVTQYERPKTMAVRLVSGPLHADGEHRLESIGEGTRYHFKLEGESGGVFRLADPILVPLIKRAIEADLHTLKALLEAKVAAGA